MRTTPISRTIITNWRFAYTAFPDITIAIRSATATLNIDTASFPYNFDIG